MLKTPTHRKAQPAASTSTRTTTTTTAIIFITITTVILTMISWTSLLLFLCSALTPVLCCDWLRHYGRLSNTSLTLIQVMGGELTEQETPVPFPKKLYRHIHRAEVTSQLVFIRDSLELIAGLYCHDNLSSVTWDTVKTKHFRMSINRQTHGLNSCVFPSHTEQQCVRCECLQLSTNRRADSRLRKYYVRLAASTLLRTGGSSASWELIRKETKLHLEQLDMLVISIRRRSTPTQQPH